MRDSIARPSFALAAICSCFTACGDPAGVDPSATGTSTGAPIDTTAAPTGTTEPPDPTGEPPGTTVAADPTTSDASTSSGTGTTSDTSTTSETATTSTGTTSAETDTTTGGLCAISEETGGDPVDWARHFGWPDKSGVLARNVAIGPDGTIALADNLYSVVDFGGGPVDGNFQLAAFLTRLDPQGEHLDSKPLVPTDGEAPTIRVAYALTGDLYVAGGFSGTLDLGGDPLIAPFGLDGSADIVWATYDVFLARFAPDGAHVWSKNFGDEFSQEAFDLAVTPTGGVVITGPNKGVLELGGEPLGVDGGKQTTSFVAEFTPDGEHVWSRSFGPPWVVPYGVDIDADGRITSWGYADDGIDFGGGPLPPDNLLLFVLQLDPQGEHRWSRRSLPGHVINDMLVDPTGAVMLTGNVSGNDAFVARLAAEDGALVWEKADKPAGPWSEGTALALDPAGNTIVTGRSLTTLDLGDGPLGVGGMFFAAFDAAGATVWQRALGMPPNSGPYGLAGGPAGELVFTGTLTECLDLGTGPLTPIGWDDLLVVRFAP